MKMVGAHNRENLALALSVAEYLKFPKSAIAAIENYPGLSHRLELVGERNGVKFINDSKATTVESVLAAARSCIESVASGSKMYLLVGGRDKNLPWENLNALSIYKNIQFLFFGECGALAQTKSGLKGPIFSKLNLAINSAKNESRSGDWIVLSPGGSSLDEFKNFEERGEFFKHVVTA
jgi:UDP-N-acetylmuramoylalanine--D-glutamate ligase